MLSFGFLGFDGRRAIAPDWPRVAAHVAVENGCRCEWQGHNVNWNAIIWTEVAFLRWCLILSGILPFHTATADLGIVSVGHEFFLPFGVRFTKWANCAVGERTSGS